MRLVACDWWNWMLFEEGGHLTLDVLVEHGAISFTVTAELDAAQRAAYDRDGLAALLPVVGEMRHQGFFREWKAHVLPAGWAERSTAAVHEWKARGVPEFILKPSADLTEADYLAHAVWASWHEPEDLQTLVALGYDEPTCRARLEAVGFSDEYAFPLPDTAFEAPFHYVHETVSVTTSGGRSLTGYRTGAALCVFAGERSFLFNARAMAMSRDQVAAMADALDDDRLLPFALTYRASARRETFDLPR